jgi:hypothetical protein
VPAGYEAMRLGLLQEDGEVHVDPGRAQLGSRLPARLPDESRVLRRPLLSKELALCEREDGPL